MAAFSDSTKSSAGKPPRVTIISYTRPGIVAPVYITTSISDPPWVLTEMSVSRKKTSNGDYIFYQQYENVTPGLYQYKIRIGEHEWVVDDSQLKGFDGHGNLNNFKHVTENEPYALTEQITATSNADPSQRESPLLPHERLDLPQKPATAQILQQEVPPPESKTIQSPPKRTATLPLETITESDEPSASSSEQSPQVHRSLADDERSEEDDELDNAILLPHEADEDERYDDAYGPLDDRMDPQIVRESGTLVHEEIPTMLHEDVPPPPDEDESLLLPHERANRTPSERSTDPDIMMPGPVYEDGDQVFDYEMALETGPLVYDTLTPSEHSRSSSPSHWVTTDDGTREQRSGRTDSVGKADGSRVTDKRIPPSEQQSGSSEEEIQETDGPSDWPDSSVSRAGLFENMAHPVKSLALFTPPQTPHRKSDVTSFAKGGPDAHVTIRHVYRQDSSNSTNTATGSHLLEPTAKPSPHKTAAQQDHKQNYLRTLFQTVFDNINWFFCYLFRQKARETSCSVLVVLVAIAVYRYLAVYEGGGGGGEQQTFEEM